MEAESSIILLLYIQEGLNQILGNPSNVLSISIVIIIVILKNSILYMIHTISKTPTSIENDQQD